MPGKIPGDLSGMPELFGNRNLFFGKLYGESGLSKIRFSHPEPFGTFHIGASVTGIGGAVGPAMDVSFVVKTVLAVEAQAQPAFRMITKINKKKGARFIRFLMIRQYTMGFSLILQV